MNDNKDFKPFIPADKILPELSVFAIVLGIILAIVFGAANAYLGLRVGMTVSASIPAAVLSMGIIRLIFKRDSILENNIVQTIGSAGESLAAGAIFTIPAIFLWFKERGEGNPSYLYITMIALVGGILGILFMIPLRKALIVKEHGILPYPEGTACAEVLLAGEEGGVKAKTTFIGLGIGALYKLITDGFKLFPSEIDYSLKNFKGTGFGVDVLPALLGVGFIVGADISSFLFAGAILGWFVVMPIIYYFGSLSPDIIYPATKLISEMVSGDIWSNYLRYVGAGAVAFGGIYSLITSLPLIISTFKDSMSDYRKMGKTEGLIPRTDRDLSNKVIIFGVLFIVIIIGFTPIVPVGILGGLLIVIFGFFFATVASRIVGLVGSSNSPVSGMAIATLLIAAFFFKSTGMDNFEGMIATISVGSIIAIIAAISGDTSQDLKTGFLLGATPRKQQIGELIGVCASALAIGGVLMLLNTAWGFGSKEIPAPQATLMKLVVEGVFGGKLPWVLVFGGAGIGLFLAILKLPILPIAIGLYLPIHLSTPLMIGGLIRYLFDRRLKKDKSNELAVNNSTETGILFSSGLIAGEGIIGILLAVFAIFNFNISFAGDNPSVLGQLASIIAFAALGFILYTFANNAYKSHMKPPSDKNE